MDHAPTHDRREILAVAILTLLGAGLRLVHANRLGLTHFDEGIYALAGLWVYSPKGLAGVDPLLIPYAPPGFPILVGLAYFLTQGPSDWAAIAVAEVCGIASIPVVGWIGRRTFGPGAGGASSALAAFSGPHVAFSRMALTDAPYLLLWLIALGLGARFLERPRIGRAIAFGLAVGLTQNLKYSGWLAGAIVILAVLPAIREDWSRSLRAVGLGSLAAILAGLVYLPWIDFVESHGGYSKLLAHHRGYLGAPSNWLPHLRSQLAQAVGLSGGPAWGAGAWTLAWISARISLSPSSADRPGPRRGVVFPLTGLIVGAALLEYFPELPWWLGLCLSPWLAIDSRPASRVLGVSFVVLSVLTPFYHPYARLWLPLHAAGWIICGWIISSVSRGLDVELDSWLCLPPLRARLAWIAAILPAFALLALATTRPKALPGLLDPTDELRLGLGQLLVRQHLPPSRSGRPLLTLVRPPVTFYLLGKFPMAPQPDLSRMVDYLGSGGRGLIDKGLLSERERAAYLTGFEEERIDFVDLLRVETSLPAALDEEPSVPFKKSPIRPMIELDYVERVGRPKN